MKNFRFLLLAPAFALIGTGFQLLPTTHAAESATQRVGRAAFTAAYNKQNQAMLRKDAGTMVSFLAPDFEMHSSNGQVYNRAQAEAMLRQSLNGQIMGVSVSFTKASTRILSLTWRGSDAIVMSETTAVAIGKKGARTSRSEAVSVARDFWSATPQGWKLRQSVERQSKLWVNGQRIR